MSRISKEGTVDLLFLFKVIPGSMNCYELFT